ncbi:hypothetical protein AAF695_02550 [Aerococcus viridans]
MEFSNEDIEKIFNIYHKKCVSYVHDLYPAAFDENPEAFLMLDPEFVDVFLVMDQSNTLNVPNTLYISQGNGKRLVIKLNKDQAKDSLKFESEKEFIQKYITEKYHSGKILYDEYSSVSFLHPNDNIQSVLNDIRRKSDISMKFLVKEHGKLFVRHISNKSTYYSQNAYKYVYSDLDFTELLSTANNPDFEYALNESLASYENSLYLAATATAGTALETLIITILERANIDYEVHSSTELGYLVGQLLKNDIIDKKMKQRIMNAASLRNLASHANKGKTIREDARLVYQTIMTLGELYFQI